MSAIDPDGNYLAVAGSSGFTHYSFLTRKWKIFGNADQEKEIQVTGGLLWWRDFICLTCFNHSDQKDEVINIHIFLLLTLTCIMGDILLTFEKKTYIQLREKNT